MLAKAKYLDVREVTDPQIAESVNIPWPQLSSRVHELPPRAETIRIANVDAAANMALQWLHGAGRAAELTEGFEFGAAERLRLWSPNPFLAQVIPKIKPGRSLDLACGSGRDVVFMAANGFEVTAIDHLPDAIAFGQDLERRYLKGLPTIRWVCGDLDEPLSADRFDLICCCFYLNRARVAEAVSMLNPGGHLVMETFTSVHRERFGKPRTESFVLQPGELANLVQPLTILEFEEAWHGDRHTARIWAERQGD